MYTITGVILSEQYVKFSELYAWNANWVKYAKKSSSNIHNIHSY